MICYYRPLSIFTDFMTHDFPLPFGYTFNYHGISVFMKISTELGSFKICITCNFSDFVVRSLLLVGASMVLDF